MKRLETTIAVLALCLLPTAYALGDVWSTNERTDSGGTLMSWEVENTVAVAASLSNHR